MSFPTPNIRGTVTMEFRLCGLGIGSNTGKGNRVIYSQTSRARGGLTTWVSRAGRSVDRQPRGYTVLTVTSYPHFNEPQLFFTSGFPPFSLVPRTLSQTIFPIILERQRKS